LNLQGAIAKEAFQHWPLSAKVPLIFPASINLHAAIMAAEATFGSNSNGIRPDLNTKAEHLSPAEILEKKHEADLAHRASIEDIEDEEDIMHPTTHKTTPGPVIEENMTSADGSTGIWAQPMSTKAAGKQKARDEANIDETKAKTPYKALDLKSDDVFPSLGSVPKPTIPAASSAW
jgi:hypothetical protein